MKLLKWVGYTVLALILVSIPAYWWLFVESHVPFSAHYSIDIATLRQLADTSVGNRPTSIRVETVAHLSAPETVVISGGGWRSLDMPVSAYELIYKDHAIIIDTAFNRDVAKQMRSDVFDDAAFARVGSALTTAQLIIVTHEHPDHVGGLLAQPKLKELMGKARLTRVQVAEIQKALGKEPIAGLNIPSGLFDSDQAIDYERYQAVAPGVVLIKAPGHTPGSQMVYVQRADGQEFLFLGDVAWQMRNIDSIRERPRLVTWLGGEDREAVMGELVELNRLHASEPHLNIMPGHDPDALARFLQAGLLTKGF